MRNRRSADTAYGKLATGAKLPIPSKGYRMAARSGRRPSRQIKTLAALALSMTLGTALLSWVHDLTPARSSATTLRSFGVAAVYTPKNFELNAIMREIVSLVARMPEAA